MSQLTPYHALEQALLEALHDEYKACATYRRVIQRFGPIRPFVNIIESEQRHIQALLVLFKKYQIAIPDDDWDQRVTVPESVQDACQQGVQAEIENADMYHRLLSATQNYQDVQQVFLNLQRASQHNHLPAFQRCASQGTTAVSSGRGRMHGRQHRGQHHHLRGRGMGRGRCL